jgi:Xaa-Pro dipeptidase
MTVPQGKYPAKAHAQNVVEWLKSKGESTDGVFYLEGQKLKMLEVGSAADTGGWK